MGANPINDLALTILFEDNHCLVVAKPARLLTTDDATGDVTLNALATQYIKTKYSKPGNVYLSLIHRIDRPVTGAVLFAKTSKAAARLAEQFRVRTVEKLYLAIVEGAPPQSKGLCHDWLLKNQETNTSRVIDVRDPNFNRLKPQEALLSWNQIAALTADSKPRALLAVQPVTGRSHQIRLQLSHAGYPILGDQKYGSLTPYCEGTIALHSYGLRFKHPTRDEVITVYADVPAEFLYIAPQSTNYKFEDFIAVNSVGKT